VISKRVSGKYEELCLKKPMAMMDNRSGQLTSCVTVGGYIGERVDDEKKKWVGG